MPGCLSSHQHWQAEAGFLPGPFALQLWPLVLLLRDRRSPRLELSACRQPSARPALPASQLVSGERPAPRPPCPSEHTGHAQAHAGVDSDPDLKELCGSLSVEGAGGTVAGWGVEPTPARKKQRWKDRPEAPALRGLDRPPCFPVLPLGVPRGLHPLLGPSSPLLRAPGNQLQLLRSAHLG